MSTDAELEAAATAYILKKPDSKHACPACGEITAYVTDIKTFIAGAEWQANQYTEALQFMREMAEVLEFNKSKWEAVSRSNYKIFTAWHTCSDALEKYRASRWGKE